MARLPGFLGGKKEEAPPDFKAQLSALGLDVITDGLFDKSKENIKENAGLMTEDQIKALSLSPKREVLLIQTMAMLKYVMYHAPHAKVRENRHLNEAVTSCVDLLHDDVERILSDAPEEAVVSEVMEDFAQMNIFVANTFDTPRVSVGKSVVVQTIAKTDNRYKGEEEELG